MKTSTILYTRNGDRRLYLSEWSAVARFIQLSPAPERALRMDRSDAKAARALMVDFGHETRGRSEPGAPTKAIDAVPDIATRAEYCLSPRLHFTGCRCRAALRRAKWGKDPGSKRAPAVAPEPFEE